LPVRGYTRAGMPSVTVYLSESEYVALHELARRRGTNIPRLVRQFVAEALRRAGEAA